MTYLYICGPILNFLKNNILPSNDLVKHKLLATIDQYEIDEETGLLFRIYLPNKNWNKDTYYQLCLPKPLQAEILHHMHDSNMGGGHYNPSKTFWKLIRFYYFPGCWKFIENYVNSCINCQKRRTVRHPQLPPLHQLAVDGVFDLIGLDFIGPIVA